MKVAPPIIVRLVGGLGNQMFQYAAGLAVARRTEGRLLIDADFVGAHVACREFELDRAFVGPFHLATLAEKRAMLGWRMHFRRAMSRPSFSFLWGKRVIVERNRGVLPARVPAYLVGYWQSESCFLEVARELRKLFTFVPPDAANAALLREIEACESAAVHVRRGDYAAVGSITAVHGLCPPSYYESAAKVLLERRSNLRFFVFSDDLDWARDNIKLPADCVYVDVNRNGAAFNDMRLMSMCRHQVIANSTFSWWAAWLNDNREKVIIAPKRWFAVDVPAGSICPPAWVRL